MGSSEKGINGTSVKIGHMTHGNSKLTSSFKSLSSSLFSLTDHLDFSELGEVPLRLSFGDCDSFDASAIRLLKLLLLFGDAFSSFCDFDNFSSSVLFSVSLFGFLKSQLNGGFSGRLKSCSVYCGIRLRSTNAPHRIGFSKSITFLSLEMNKKEIEISTCSDI